MGLIVKMDVMINYLHSCESDVITIKFAIEIASAVILWSSLLSSSVGNVVSSVSFCVFASSV